MTSPRTHPVADADAHARAVAEYRQHGYRIVDDGERTTTLKRSTGPGLLRHLALFFTVGWLTLGLLNAYYAWRTRRKTRDRVQVVTQ